MFNAPIPGESLTVEPGNAPWEQPPQYASVDEALTFYMEKFEDDETMEDALFILDQDIPIELFVTTLTMNGEMLGKHTSDVSLLIAPVLHEHLKSLADAAGVNYREFQGKTKDEKAEDKKRQTFQILLEKAISSGEDESGIIQQTSDMLDSPELTAPETEAPVGAAPEEMPSPPKGLMSRRT